MKKVLLILLTLVFLLPVQGQNAVKAKKKEGEKAEIKMPGKKVEVKVSGYVRYEALYDTYKSVDTREGEVYLYPLPASFDAQNVDINKVGQLEMYGFQSRLKFAASGPDAFGAKTTGAIEGDFLGIGNADIRSFRLRHAFVKLNWEKLELLMGQYWHPMFVTQNFPATVSMGAGVPFHVLNRAPQIRATYKLIDGLTVSGTALMHGYHISKGPIEAQRNSGRPDSQFQLIYSKGSILGGFTAGYKWLKPRLSYTNATGTYVTDEIVGSYNASAFFKLKLKPVTIKLEGIIGENLTHYVMIGGYGAAQDPSLVDDFSYSNLTSMAVWGDIQTNGKKVVAGFFGGYSANLGSSDPYFSIAGYNRSETVANIYRLSPRVVFNSGKTSFGIEYMLSGAVYGTGVDAKGLPVNLQDPTINHRFLFSAKYAF